MTAILAYTRLSAADAASMLARTYQMARQEEGARYTYYNQDDGIAMTVEGEEPDHGVILLSARRDGPPIHVWTLSLRWRPIETTFGTRWVIDAWFYGDLMTDMEVSGLIEFDRQMGWLVSAGLEQCITVDQDHHHTVQAVVSTMIEERTRAYSAAKARALGAQKIPGTH